MIIENDEDAPYLKYGSTAVCDAYSEWVNEAYRTVDFGTEPQEVPEEFYLWLKDNAVKQKIEVSGKWYFNETLTTDIISENVEFTSNGKNFSSIRVETTFGIDLIYGFASIYNGDDGWTSEVFRLIDFGITPQTVSAEFYNWLTQNAICLESANQLLDIEGLKIYDAMLREVIDKKAENIEATTTVAGLMSAADKAKLDTLTETQLQKLLALIVDDNELNTMLEEVLV